MTTSPDALQRPITTHPILVVGGTGKTGRRVAERLSAARPAGAHRLARRRPAVRLGGPLDLGRRARGHLRRLRVVLPDLGAPGAPEAITAFAAAALAAGTRRLVLLSGRGEEEAQRAERMLQASGADWTIVRCSWFCQNFDESFFAEPLAYGELALPVGDVGEPFVDVEDIADVAVRR